MKSLSVRRKIRKRVLIFKNTTEKYGIYIKKSKLFNKTIWSASINTVFSENFELQ